MMRKVGAVSPRPFLLPEQSGGMRGFGWPPQEAAMEQTSTAKLAAEYVRLGGGRLAKIDDNHLSTRQWKHETRAAEAFWNEHIARLDEKRRDEVITHLPTINQV
jgi:hypothetical protein